MKSVFLAMTVFASVSLAAGTRRGPFAFHYEPVLTEEQLSWYAQFDLLVTHDPLPRVQVERLHAAGTKLVLYEWSVAFYESRATEWQRSVMRTRQVLNNAPLTGGVGSDEAPAWYFDPAESRHAARRAADLIRRLRQHHYDGVFLDTTTIESVHPAARSEYARRHPGLAYDAAFSRFLRELRLQLPSITIFTNQGYRSAEHYLPHVDWDLTESLITFPRDGRFVARPWNDPLQPWQSIHFLMNKVMLPMIERYPRARFGHLNYSEALEPDTIQLVVAVAQLFGGEGFVASPSIQGEPDPLYFRDPGRALSPPIDLAGGKGTVRYFEKGITLITDGTIELSVENRGGRALRNHRTSEHFCGTDVVIPPNHGGPRAYFFDAIADCSPLP